MIPKLLLELWLSCVKKGTSPTTAANLKVILNHQHPWDWPRREAAKPQAGCTVGSIRLYVYDYKDKRSARKLGICC